MTNIKRKIRNRCPYSEKFQHGWQRRTARIRIFKNLSVTNVTSNWTMKFSSTKRAMFLKYVDVTDWRIHLQYFWQWWTMWSWMFAASNAMLKFYHPFNHRGDSYNPYRKRFLVISRTWTTYLIVNCSFMQPRVNFLGHYIDDERIHTDYKKFQTSHRAHLPSNRKSFYFFWEYHLTLRINKMLHKDYKTIVREGFKIVNFERPLPMKNQLIRWSKHLLRPPYWQSWICLNHSF